MLTKKTAMSKKPNLPNWLVVQVELNLDLRKSRLCTCTSVHCCVHTIMHHFLTFIQLSRVSSNNFCSSCQIEILTKVKFFLFNLVDLRDNLPLHVKSLDVFWAFILSFGYYCFRVYVVCQEGSNRPRKTTWLNLLRCGLTYIPSHEN